MSHFRGRDTLGIMKLRMMMILALMVACSEARVIVISVDGLRPDAITKLGPELVPNFYRLREEGAFTDNARTDFDYSETLPNHASMITGRPVSGECGHGLVVNFGGITTNLHVDGYKASMFDVAHDHGFSTALIAGKGKFAAFSGSYDEVKGAPDLVGVDNGRDKLDFFQANSTDPLSVSSFIGGLRALRWDLTMLHLRGPDIAGHSADWSLDLASPYLLSVRSMDGFLGEVFELIDSTPWLGGSTYLIVTSDHGGTAGTYTHLDAEIQTNYTIPFFVWGPGVKEGGDLYEINPGFVDPARSRPGFNSPSQPIRNGMVGNLALQLMDLPPIPGSCLNLAQQFRVNDPPDFQMLYPGLSLESDDNGNGLANFADYLLGADPLGVDRPDLLPAMDGPLLVLNLRNNVSDVGPFVEISANGQTWGPLLDGATFLRKEARETRDGVRLTLKVPALLPRILLRQVMEPVR
ncbi:MAG: alkaline phosphatase family protein [Akkermansiaceae bacterium]